MYWTSNLISEEILYYFLRSNKFLNTLYKYVSVYFFYLFSKHTDECVLEEMYTK